MAEIHADYLILGGGIAGTTAAETIRTRDTRGNVVVISDEPHPLYSRVLLPSYIQGGIRREQLFLRSLADYERKRITLFLGEEATIVDMVKRKAYTSADNIFYFKKLLITMGGRPRPWRVEGAEEAYHAGRGVPVFRLHTIDDADAIRLFIQSSSTRSVAIVGGGFIGLECVNSFAAHGFLMHCILRERGYWGDRLKEEGSAFLEEFLERRGITFHRESEVLFLKKGEDGTVAVRTNTGTISVDGVAVGVGLRRNTDMFQAQGIEIQEGIRTNEYLETGLEDVWAAGDIAEWYSPLFGRHMMVGNWSNSFLQGRAAGVNMVGERQAFGAVPTYSLNALGRYVTFLGCTDSNEETHTISRGGGSERFYEQFFIKNGALVGAIMIDKFEDKKTLEMIIQERTPFDIKEI